MIQQLPEPEGIPGVMLRIHERAGDGWVERAGVVACAHIVSLAINGPEIEIRTDSQTAWYWPSEPVAIAGPEAGPANAAISQALLRRLEAFIWPELVGQ